MGMEEVFRNIWIEPSPERTVSFLFTFFFLACIIIGVHFSYRHRLRLIWEKQFIKKMTDCGIYGKPEEGVIRDLVQRYRIAPPAQLLSSLGQYDDIASQDIQRVTREVMPLADRIDRIEYLYSVRIQAFANDPAIGGADVLLPSSSVGIGSSPIPSSAPLAKATINLTTPEESQSQELPSQPPVTSEPTPESSPDKMDQSSTASPPATPQVDLSALFEDLK
jgi:hypothetical protein